MPNTNHPPEAIRPDDRTHGETIAAPNPPADGDLSAPAAADGVDLEGINRAVEAFSILGNETRLSILLALWEAYEPFAEDNALLYSELRERLGNPDSGQFNYHLDKLDGHFIRNTDGGYELRDVGHQLVGTVIAGTGIEEPQIRPTELDEGTDALAYPTGSLSSCFRCGAPTAVSYQDGVLYLTCTECEGNWESSEIRPSGVLARGAFDPAGLIDRTPEQAWNAFFISLRHSALSAVEGVCPRCYGPVDTSLHVCDDHDSEGLCDNCGQAVAISDRSQCPVCKWVTRWPPFWTVAMHPDVVGFFNEREEPLQYASDAVHPPPVLDLDNRQELVSDEPPRVRITYQYEGDNLEVLIDEELNVLEVIEPD